MKILSTMVVLGFFGCVTPNNSNEIAQVKVVTPALYTLKEGDKIQNKLPLPNQTKILVKWTQRNGEKKTQEGFRGWDVDHDGRFDMLEALDPEGNPNMWAYDFDGDGVIDLVEKATKDDVNFQKPEGISPSH